MKIEIIKALKRLKAEIQTLKNKAIFLEKHNFKKAAECYFSEVTLASKIHYELNRVIEKIVKGNDAEFGLND